MVYLPLILLFGFIYNGEHPYVLIQVATSEVDCNMRCLFTNGIPLVIGFVFTLIASSSRPLPLIYAADDESKSEHLITLLVSLNIFRPPIFHSVTVAKYK